MKFIMQDIATAEVENVALIIEGKTWSVIDLMGCFKEIEIIPSATDSTTFDIYMDLPVEIQGGYQNAALDAASILYISRDGNYLRNFVPASTIAEFKQKSGI